VKTAVVIDATCMTYMTFGPRSTKLIKAKIGFMGNGAVSIVSNVTTRTRLAQWREYPLDISVVKRRRYPPNIVYGTTNASFTEPRAGYPTGIQQPS